jgi:antitoxin component YwqK of YwqJK toxin-antitoxin module
MRSNHASVSSPRLSVLAAATVGALVFAPPIFAVPAPVVSIRAAGFQLGTEISAGDGTNRFQLALDRSNPAALPFNQSAVKQSSEPARIGPDPKKPYFTVRFALPVPPENLTNNFAALTGMDPQVFTHNHSPGFEILPNGDCLAIYFSTPPGKSEADPTTSFIQARLRYGAEEWDLPELFFKTENFNDQSGLLWNDHGTLRFFGGGRGLSDSAPFKMATSTNNGATWVLSLPQLDSPATNYTAQPITSAFRSGTGILPVSFNQNADAKSTDLTGKMPVPLFFAMDGDGASSFLWRSTDNGIHWQQMAGRTGGRHSVIVPLDDKGNLLSIGGKNAAVNGWSPENVSTNFGASWSASVASPFPPLGSAQRPSLIKLADGNLFFVSDAWLQKKDQAPPSGWKFGDGCFVAISTNNGAAWRIKPLPVQLPNHEFRKHGTVGYVTARQAANGVIHILTTETQPCLHYELNEAWIFSDAGDIAPENSGGEIKKFSEKFPNGKIRSQWSARICPNGRYLLDGQEIDFYENGGEQHEVTYANGRKTGDEVFWSPDGKKVWTWLHDLKWNHAVWTLYWPNGKKKIQSLWNTKPEARDLKRSFFGLVADGPVKQWNEDGSLKFSGNFSDGLLLKEAGR